MSPSTNSHLSPKAGKVFRLVTPPIAIVALCWAFGMGVVVWRASSNARSARARARIEAKVRSTALEMQFKQALGAAEVLGAVARRSGGAVSNLLQTVSLALPTVSRRGGLDELTKLGYDYALFVAGSDPDKALSLIRHGMDRLGYAVVQPFRVQNLELRLALQRHGGWLDKSKVLVESLVVLLGSFCLFALIGAASSRRQNEETLAQAYRLQSAEAGQKQLEEEFASTKRSAQEALEKIQADLARAREEIVRHTQALREAVESRESVEAALKQVQQSAGEEQARLQRTVQSQERELEAKRSELAGAFTRLQAAEQKAIELEGALATALQAAEAARVESQVGQEKAHAAIEDLQAQLDNQMAEGRKSAAANASRLKEAEATVNELNTKLSSAELKAKTPDLAAQQNEDAPPPEPAAESAGLSIPHLPGSTPMESDSVALSGDELETASPQTKRRRGRRKDQNQIELFGAETSEPPPEPPLVEASRKAITKSELTAVPDSSGPKQPIDEDSVEPSSAAAPDAEVEPAEHKPITARRFPAPHPVDPAQLRRAINEILPLLTDRDPGAKDCFKANRSLFRSAVGEAVFEEFEQVMREGAFETALERLTKVARRHGIHI